jgi:uncharacterized membrane protein YbaN (DUF454 family)
MWKGTRTALGYVFPVTGIAGVLLPIIPGVPLLVAAAAVLGADHPLIRPWKERVNRWMRKDLSPKR